MIKLCNEHGGTQIHGSQISYSDYPTTFLVAAGVASSIQQLAAGCTKRWSNPGESNISCAFQTVPEAHPASCTKCTGSFLRVKWQERGSDHPPAFRIEVAFGLELHIHLPSVPVQARHRMTFTFTPPVLLERYIWPNLHTQTATFLVPVRENVSLPASYTDRNYLNR